MKFRSVINLQVVALFALAGPPIGAAFWLGLNVGGWDAFVMSIAVLYSWVFGFIPAALTGLFSSASYILLPAHLSSRRIVRASIGCLWGYLATVAFKFFVFGGEDLPYPVALEVIGALSGASCGALVPPPRVGPNNSFKPKPLRGSA